MNRTVLGRCARVFACAGALAGMLLGTAQAASPHAASTSGSIVFQHAGNIFVMRPDGSHLRRVTRGGTSAAPYSEPTQSDSGIIGAAHNLSDLYRMDRNGRSLSKPVHVASGLGFPGPLHSLAFSPALSRDGTIFAVSSVTTQGVYDPSTGLSGTSILTADIQYWNALTGKKISQTHAAGTEFMYVSWIDSRRALIFAPYNIAAKQVDVDVYNGQGSVWFADEDSSGGSMFDRQTLTRGQLSRQGNKLAVVRGINLKGDWHKASIQLYAVSSLSTPPTPTCSIAATHSPFGAVSWSPDGSSLTWSDSKGVWVSAINPSASNCGISPRLIAKGGANPYWGPTGVSG